MPFLNSSTKGLPSYSLSLTTLLKFYTNSFIVFPLCSNLLNSAVLTVFSSSSLKSFLKSAKNSPTVLYSNTLTFKSSNRFSFHTSAELSYTYNNIHWIYSFIATLLILILMYNLHTVINFKTFSRALSNTCSFDTFVLIPCTSSYCAANSTWSCVCIAASVMT